MNLIVFGPGMEDRPLPDWAFLPIPYESLTALEVLVQRIGQEIYHNNDINILGLPWVNPRGRGKAYASVNDYLNDPVLLRRALELAFIAPRATYLANRAVITSDPDLEEQLKLTGAWVTSHLSTAIPHHSVVWWNFDPEFHAVFDTYTAHARAEQRDAALLRDVAKNLNLPGTSTTLTAFCSALSPLFQLKKATRR